MGEQVGNAVAAWVEVEFVWNLEGIECLMQFACPTVKTVGVLGPTVEINLHLHERRGVLPRQNERAIQVPEFLLDGIAKYTGQ